MSDIVLTIETDVTSFSHELERFCAMFPRKGLVPDLSEIKLTLSEHPNVVDENGEIVLNYTREDWPHLYHWPDDPISGRPLKPSEGGLWQAEPVFVPDNHTFRQKGTCNLRVTRVGSISGPNRLKIQVSYMGWPPPNFATTFGRDFSLHLLSQPIWQAKIIGGYDAPTKFNQKKKAKTRKRNSDETQTLAVENDLGWVQNHSHVEPLEASWNLSIPNENQQSVTDALRTLYNPFEATIDDEPRAYGYSGKPGTDTFQLFYSNELRLTELIKWEKTHDEGGWNVGATGELEFTQLSSTVMVEGRFSTVAYANKIKADLIRVFNVREISSWVRNPTPESLPIGTNANVDAPPAWEQKQNELLERFADDPNKQTIIKMYFDEATSPEIARAVHLDSGRVDNILTELRKWYGVPDRKSLKRMKRENRR